MAITEYPAANGEFGLRCTRCSRPRPRSGPSVWPVDPAEGAGSVVGSCRLSKSVILKQARRRQSTDRPRGNDGGVFHMAVHQRFRTLMFVFENTMGLKSIHYLNETAPVDMPTGVVRLTRAPGFEAGGDVWGPTATTSPADVVGLESWGYLSREYRASLERLSSMRINGHRRGCALGFSLSPGFQSRGGFDIRRGWL